MRTFDQLVEIASDTLEPNISFANGGYGDNVHHQLIESFPEMMSYMAMYIIMPILTGCAGSMLHDLIKVRGGSLVRLGVKSGPMHVVGKKEFIDDNIITTDELVEIKSKSSLDDEKLAQAKVDSSKASEAETALSQFLVSNGWPTKVASVKAKHIISRIIEESRED